ncbi:hypothetical protein [Rivularia sp. UHCC 0363]|nr:hypothetical protein [Rivularia sp. UHCC 0363]MEA5597763.1 hypothetical protein [Rivularia sp. UHCC 0363]
MGGWGDVGMGRWGDVGMGGWGDGEMWGWGVLLRGLLLSDGEFHSSSG